MAAPARAWPVLDPPGSPRLALFAYQGFCSAGDAAGQQSGHDTTLTDREDHDQRHTHHHDVSKHVVPIRGM